MCRLVESLRVFHNQIEALPYHQSRVCRTCTELLKLPEPLSIPSRLPAVLEFDQIYKMRVIYSDRIEMVEFVPYLKKDIRSLKLKIADELDYTYKYENRLNLDSYLDPANPTEHILFVKNGLLTDSSYANIALLKDGLWYTPAQPLLAGTRRTQLIDQGLIIPTEINPADLPGFETISLLNAMLPLGDCVLPVSAIHE